MGKVTITSIIVKRFYNLLGHTCRFVFTLSFPRNLSAGKPLADTNLLLFSGKKGARMLKAVLLSIYYNWDKIPRLTLISDGTPLDALRESLRFWPYPYEIKCWEDCAAWHRNRDRQGIIDFAHANPYARKLLSILAEAEQRPVFYCDTDVLWFAEPRLPAPAADQCIMRISSDNTHCYHLPALRYLHREDLLEKPAINCGVIYLSGSIYDHYPDFEALTQFMRIFNEPFSEQTTFALLADRFGDTWSPDEIILTTKDLHWPLIPRYLFKGTQSARHHVATKHSWFWRDALFILLRKNKTRPHAS
jgi:hypothetical protein